MVSGSAGEPSGALHLPQGQGAVSAPATLPEEQIVQLRERMKACKCGPEWGQIKEDHDEVSFWYTSCPVQDQHSQHA